MSYRRIFLCILFFLAMFLLFVFFISTASTVKAPSEFAPTFSPPDLKIQTTPTISPATPTPVVLKDKSGNKKSFTVAYTVQAGDTLISIADRYGLKWIDLANINHLTDPSLITVGQVIKITTPKNYKKIDPYYTDKIVKVEGNTKHILIVLSEQKLYTYEGETKIGEYLISSGVPAFPTVTGEFKVWIKLEKTDMSGGTGADSYYLPGVKWTMYFYGDYGIHGTYWHNNFGTPMSHGCINMSEDDAEIVFNWAEVGTIVQVIK